MPSERKTFTLNDFSGGQAPDYKGMSLLPQYDILKNVWLDPMLVSRPFNLSYRYLGTQYGYLAKTHDNQLAYSDGSNLYINNQPVNVLNGTLRLKADISQKRTLFANGGNQIVYWDGSISSVINGVSGVYALATIQGFTKERVCYVSLSDKHTLNYSSLDITDFGSQIIDDDNINDAWTDGGSIYNFPHEIIDVVEFKNVIFVFTRHAIYTLSPSLGLDLGEETDDIFNFEIQKFQEVDLYNITPVKTTNTIYFVTREGISSIGLTEFNNFSNVSVLPMLGMRNTILDATNPETGIINIDTKRNLLYLTPNSSSNICYVCALALENVWFEWDLPFQSVISLNNETYTSVINDVSIYTLVDIIEYPAGINVKIYTGILSLDDPFGRKHIRSLYVDIFTVADKIDYVIDVDDKPVTNKLLNKKTANTTDEYRFTARSGQRGEKIKLVSEFTVYGYSRFEEFGMEYLLKLPRRNLKS